MNSALWGVAVILTVVITHTATMPTTLPDFDAAEFLVIAKNGGIAHPPGYPLYSALLRLVYLTFGSNVSLVSLASSISIAFSAAAAWVMFHLTSRLTGRSALAFASTAVVFTTGIVWRTGTGIEPFALNLLLVAGSLLCAWKVLSDGGRWWALGLGALFGLGFCNHHTMALVLPLAALCLWHSPMRISAATAFFAAGAVAGLTPIGYFFLQDPSGPYVWGDWRNPMTQAFHHLFRTHYGTFSLTSGGSQDFWIGPKNFLMTLPRQLSGVFLIPTSIGLVLALRRRFPGQTGSFLAALGLVFLLCGLAFPMLFGLGHRSVELMLTKRFFALPLIILLPFLALGLRHVWARWLDGTRKASVYAVLLVVGVALHSGAQLFEADRSAETFYEDDVDNLFSVAQPGSLVITGSDADFFALLYGKHVLDYGANLRILAYPLTPSDWYRKQYERKYDAVAGTRTPTYREIVETEIERRPVYATTNRPGPTLSRRGFPRGPLFRLLADNEKPPGLRALVRENLRLYQKTLKLPSPELVGLLNPWERRLLPKYRRTFDVLHDQLRRHGLHTQAAKAAHWVGRLSHKP